MHILSHLTATAKYHRPGAEKGRTNMDRGQNIAGMRMIRTLAPKADRDMDIDRGS